MSEKTIINIEKLKGSENYHTWQFAMRSVLEFSDLDACILLGNNCEKDATKLKKAKAKIVLCTDESLFVHIQSLSTAAEIWKKFKDLFEEHGLTRKIGLLRKLIGIRLENCNSMSEYVSEVTGTANKLSAIDFNVTDEWLVCILLAGLTDEYKPLIMGIESSGVAITADKIKMKLLDAEYVKSTGTSESALLSKQNTPKLNNKFKKKSIKCYNCGGRGHKSIVCKKPKLSSNQAYPAAGMVTGALSARFGFSEENSLDFWYIDSGASRHMTPLGNILDEIKPTQISQIFTASNEKMVVTGSGDSKLTVKDNKLDIKSVLYVPDLSTNLLSVAQMVENGNRVVFDQKGCSIYNAQNQMIVNVKPKGGTYKIESQRVDCLLASTEDNLSKWHRRLGHMNYRYMCQMKNGLVDGITFHESKKGVGPCEICLKGKQSRKPFKHVGTRAVNFLVLVHSDLCGPMEIPSHGGSKYFMTFIDDFSHKIFIYFLKSKSQTLDVILEFKQFVENQKGLKIKILRSDNGTEYTWSEIDNLCKKYGILHQTSTTYTPQQNGVAERSNRSIKEKALCMLLDANLPKIFWAEAANTAVYILNRSFTSRLVNATPEEVWTGCKVNVDNFQIFGSPIMVMVPKQRRKKWDQRSKKMIFVGYSSTSKGYRCYDQSSRQIVTSREVVFLESVSKVTDRLFPYDSVSVGETTTFEVCPDVEISENQSGQIFENSDSDNDVFSDAEDRVNHDPYNLRQRNAEGIAAPIERYQASFVSTDPITVEEALNSKDGDKWKLAMEEELESFRVNNTWSFVQLPAGKQTVKTKWIFKTKRDREGNIVRYKARFVAKGFSQKYGIDYSDTFAPVVRYTSIRYLLALSVQLGFKIHQMDAVSAYLQSELNENIYIDPPTPSLTNDKLVCVLHKAMYGLKQSSHLWNKKMDKFLISYGLTKSKLDPCVYFLCDLSLIVAVYVDDFYIFYKLDDIRDRLRTALQTTFYMKDIGPADNFFGLFIDYGKNSQSIAIHQSRYIKEILARFNMSDSKPVKTPRDVNQKLFANMASGNDNFFGHVPYQEAVGCLLHLAQASRPDIVFAVQDVSRFNSNYGKPHWEAVKRIFRYLKGTINLKIVYSKVEPLIGYSDADWASDIDKRRSCTGYIFKFSGGAISWNSRMQPTVALSSTEAEYMALSSTIQEALWLKQFRDELNPSLSNESIQIGCDNQSAISYTENDAYRAKSKHIDIRHHFIRECIIGNSIQVFYEPTESMVADILTKPLPSPKHIFCVNEMGLSELKIERLNFVN